MSFQIKSGEKSFEELASEYSDCSSAKRGGDLGPFGRGQMQKPFEEATFGLEVSVMGRRYLWKKIQDVNENFFCISSQLFMISGRQDEWSRLDGFRCPFDSAHRLSIDGKMDREERVPFRHLHSTLQFSFFQSPL